MGTAGKSRHPVTIPAVDHSGIGAVMERQAPFLTANSEAAQASVQRDDVAIVFRGRVYDFSNLALSYVGDSRRFVPVHLDARPEFDRP
ncbi:hypothetical protein [Burkholderia sp. MSMB2157WGS]|uniref:hypothetical protein n=1 Tax=Burkholderia sp. MSMB2157WGS TaxID=1637928 RepID=UPI0007583A9B|nr:hypothetical protein [Burkholderia sp. MSMB2157WGS]KWE56422.1 hypothetical protein WT53_18520 [Burkholderia sp. MSMB2157WGS]